MTDREQQVDIAERDAVRADLEREGREELAELTEERFGALPRRKAHHEGQRMRFIATMHALIAFVVDNPDLPAPWCAALNITVKEPADVQAFLDRYEGALESKIDSAGRPHHATLFRPFDDAEFYTPISVSVRQNPES